MLLLGDHTSLSMGCAGAPTGFFLGHVFGHSDGGEFFVCNILLASSDLSPSLLCFATCFLLMLLMLRSSSSPLVLLDVVDVLAMNRLCHVAEAVCL